MADMDIRESVRGRGEAACNPAAPVMAHVHHAGQVPQPNTIVSAPRAFLQSSHPNNPDEDERSCRQSSLLQPQQAGLRSSGSYVAQTPQTIGPIPPCNQGTSIALATAQATSSNSGQSSNSCNGSKGSSSATGSENNLKEANLRAESRTRSKTCSGE